MAKKTIITLVDDLDGGEADETVSFALDGVAYEIDLTAANAVALRGVLQSYISGECLSKATDVAANVDKNDCLLAYRFVRRSLLGVAAGMGRTLPGR